MFNEETKKITLRIITPNGVFWNKPVDIVTIKTTEGFIGLQKGHIPFVASLAIDELHINSLGNSDFKKCAIAGGLVFSCKEEISIVTDAIEFSDKINLIRAKHAKEEAEHLVKQDNLSHSEHIQAELALKRALNRIKVKDDN